MLNKIEVNRIFNSIDQNLSDLEDVLIVIGKLELKGTGKTKYKGDQLYVEVKTPTGRKMFINSKNLK